MIKQYISLTKPGIIAGNLITAIAGFLFASKGSVVWTTFFGLVVGLSCVIAAACVCNNCIDRTCDQKMKRTQNRAIAKGEISCTNALCFAFVLLCGGGAFLAVFTTLTTVLAALLGFVVYVVLYSYAKHITSLATLIGSISGAIPPVVGYTAKLGEVDMPAFLLFLIVGLWQMPHFYAIAMFRKEEYQAASIPVLPLVKGAKRTKISILCYITAFLGAVIALWLMNYAGFVYLAIMLPLSLFWLYVGVTGFSLQEDHAWAKKMFRLSLQVICVLSVLLSFDYT